MQPLPPDLGGVSLVPSDSSVPLASSGSVPLVPLPARALRAYQRHVGAVWAAWPALDGPGQPAQERGAPEGLGRIPMSTWLLRYGHFVTELQPTGGGEGKGGDGGRGE